MTNYQLVISKTNWSGIGNTLKGFITALSIFDDVVIECNPTYILGNYDTILDDKHIFNGNKIESTEMIFSYRFLVLKDEENEQPNIINEYNNLDMHLSNPKFNDYFSTNCHIDWNYDPNIIHSKIKHRIFRAIDKIIFKSFIIDYINNIHTQFRNNNTLGISIRTWKADHEHNINRPYDFNIYKNKILEVLALHPEINKIVVSIDNPIYIREYTELFSVLNLPTLIIPQSEKLNHLQHAIIKVLVLSKCNYFIGNRISTFSELVFWFSKHNAITYTVF